MASQRQVLALLALTALAYIRVVSFDFSPLDDNDLIAKKLAFLSALRNAPELFRQPVFAFSYYRPLLTLSFMVDAVIWAKPAMFHLSNLLLHLGVVALVWHGLRLLQISQRAALVGAAIFALHPVQVHAVAWIPGRNDLLLAVFALPALGSFLSRHRAWLAVHLTLYAAALLTKENALVLPGLSLLAWWALRKPWRLPEFRAVIVGWVAISVTWWIIRAQVTYDPIRSGWELDSVASQSIGALILYLGKFLLPIGQAVMPTLSDSPLALFGLLVIAIAIVAGRCGVRNPRLALLGGAWVLAFLALPVVAGATVAQGGHLEHRLYLPSFGLIVLLAQVRWPIPPRRQILAMGLVLIAIVAIQLRLRHYRDALSFANAAVAESPSFHYPYILRGNLLRESTPEAALADFATAGELAPDELKVYLEQGILLGMLGRTDEALAAYDRGLALPVGAVSSSQMAVNAGSIHLRRGQFDQALARYQLAARIRPGLPEAHLGLGLSYERLEQPEAAAKAFSQALCLRADYAAARRGLARVSPE
jgi:tetratricopeptide (TPR) repeat protein